MATYTCHRCGARLNSANYDYPSIWGTPGGYANEVASHRVGECIQPKPLDPTVELLTEIRDLLLQSLDMPRELAKELNGVAARANHESKRVTQSGVRVTGSFEGMTGVDGPVDALDKISDGAHGTSSTSVADTPKVGAAADSTPAAAPGSVADQIEAVQSGVKLFAQHLPKGSKVTVTWTPSWTSAAATR